MLIECPFCHAQAKLPESKEGAKVRCTDCQKVYVARERGRRGRSSGGPSGLQIALMAGVGVVALVVIVAVTRSGKSKAALVQAPPAEPVEEAPPVDYTGWESAPVKLVRALYESAASANEAGLTARIDAERYAAGLLEQHAARVAAAAEDSEEPLGEAPRPWAELDSLERGELLRAAAQTLVEGEGDAVAALWKPYDGQVVAETENDAVVHVNVSGRSAERQAESRVIEWKLTRHGLDWKVWSWARYISPEEAGSERSARSKQITRVEMEDGTKLYQAEPRVLSHLPDTSPELAARIDKTVARMLDFSLRPRENNSAEADLIAIGKPALPILLTALYENTIVDDDTLAKAVKIHHCMRDITGYDPGFPVNVLGPDSETKRDAAVRAWFAWWIRKGELRFEEREYEPDLLDALAEPAKGN